MIRVYRLLVLAARGLPRPVLEFFIRGLARAVLYRLPWNRRRILGNYRRILAHGGADTTPEELRSILRESILHYTRVLISLLARPEDMAFARERLDLEFLPLLEELRRERRGVILAFSNFGLYPHALMALAQRGVAFRIPVVDRRMYAALPEGWGERFLSLGEASRDCVEALGRNEAVAIVNIANFLPKRLAVEFFGAPARLNYAPARLARSTGAPILAIFAIWENGRCRAAAEGPIRAGPGPDSVLRTSESLARCQEKYIRRYPAQWEVYEDLWDLEAMDAGYRFIRRVMRWV